MQQVSNSLLVVDLILACKYLKKPTSLFLDWMLCKRPSFSILEGFRSDYKASYRIKLISFKYWVYSDKGYRPILEQI